MGDVDVVAMNRVLKWIGLEMTSPDRVRALVDPAQAPYLRRPQTLIGVTADPDPSGTYSLSQTPQLQRLVRSFVPLGTSLWREGSPPTPAEKRALLDTMRALMQDTSEGTAARQGRILATSLYWNAVRSLGLTGPEARHEAAALRGLIASRRNAADRPSQEIARNADLALAVLIEAHPNAK